MGCARTLASILTSFKSSFYCPLCRLSVLNHCTAIAAGHQGTTGHTLADSFGALPCTNSHSCALQRVSHCKWDGSREVRKVTKKVAMKRAHSVAIKMSSKWTADLRKLLHHSCISRNVRTFFQEKQYAGR